MGIINGAVDDQSDVNVQQDNQQDDASFNTGRGIINGSVVSTRPDLDAVRAQLEVARLRTIAQLLNDPTINTDRGSFNAPLMSPLEWTPEQARRLFNPDGAYCTIGPDASGNALGDSFVGAVQANNDALNGLGSIDTGSGMALQPDDGSYPLGALGSGTFGIVDPANQPTPEDLQAAFRQSERGYHSDKQASVQGRSYLARPGDSISAIVGSSDPQAIGNFMRANGMTSDVVQAGQNYFVPDSWQAYGDQSAAEQWALKAGNTRSAQASTTSDVDAHDVRASFGYQSMLSRGLENATTDATHQPRLAASPSMTVWDPAVDRAREAAMQNIRTNIGLAAGGPVFTGWATGAQLMGAPNSVVNDLGVAQTGLAMSLAGIPAPGSAMSRPATMPILPQGLNPTKFQTFGKSLGTVLRSEGVPPSDTYVQGSRASGTAGDNSDLDVIHVVSDADFASLLAQRLTEIQSDKIANQILKKATEQERLSGRQISNNLEKAMWTDVFPNIPENVDRIQFSVAKDSSPFVNGPLIPLNRAVDPSPVGAPFFTPPALTTSAPKR